MNLHNLIWSIFILGIVFIIGCTEVADSQEGTSTKTDSANFNDAINKCNQYQKEQSKDVCYQDILKLKTIGLTKEQGIIVCEKISNSHRKNDCISGLALLLQDVNTCDIQQDVNYKETCYIAIARVTGNANLCSGLDAWKDQCIQSLAEATLDSTLCDGLPNKKQSLCRDDVAMLKNDSSECDSELCYVYFARINKDPAFCNNIKINLTRNYCFTVVAKEIPNSELCENVVEVHQTILPAGAIVNKQGCYNLLSD